MKATETKYLLMLEYLADQPSATQAELATALDVPTSLVNRYIKRLSTWSAIEDTSSTEHKYTLTAKGEALRCQASWQFFDFVAPLLAQVHQRTVALLRDEAAQRGWTRTVLYGATPLSDFLAEWAVEAGLRVAGLCDEMRPAPGRLQLDDLSQVSFDCLILADRDKAEDAVLTSLLAHYAPVVNPFIADGRAAPAWR